MADGDERIDAAAVTNVARLLELGGEVTRRHVVLTSISKNCQPEGDTLGHSQPQRFCKPPLTESLRSQCIIIIIIIFVY